MIQNEHGTKFPMPHRVPDTEYERTERHRADGQCNSLPGPLPEHQPQLTPTATRAANPPCPPDRSAQHVTHTSKLSVVCQPQIFNMYELRMRALGRHPIHHHNQQQ